MAPSNSEKIGFAAAIAAIFLGTGCDLIIGADFGDKTLASGGSGGAGAQPPNGGAPTVGGGGADPGGAPPGGGGAEGGGGHGEGGGGAPPACEPTTFFQLYATTSEDEHLSLAVDPCGRAYVGGRNTGTSNDLFVRGIAANGSEAWFHNPPLDGIQSTRGVAVDPDGNVVVAGEFNTSAVAFSGCMIQHIGQTDIFVAKLAPDGTCLWGVSFGAANGAESLDAVAVSPTTGTIYLAGEAPEAGLVFGSTAVPTDSMYVAALTPDGAAINAAHFARNAANIFSLSTNGDAVVVTGEYLTPIGLGGGSFPGPTGSQRFGFVARYESDLSGPTWAHGWGCLAEPCELTLESSIVEPSSDVVIAGHLLGTANIEETTIATTHQNIVVVKLSADGEELYATHYAASSHQRATSIARSPDGTYVLAGSFNGTLAIPEIPELTESRTNSQFWVAKVDGDASGVWSRQITVPTAGSTRPRVAVASDTGEVVVGMLATSAEFDDVQVLGVDQDAEVIALKVRADGSLAADR